MKFIQKSNINMHFCFHQLVHICSGTTKCGDWKLGSDSKCIDYLNQILKDDFESKLILSKSKSL
jgi:hypothetical protein